MIKKILITGGAGYIGSVLSSYLLDKGYQVVVLDDLSVGKKTAIDFRASFIPGSILDFELMTDILVGVDVVIHLAAKSLVGESVESPDLYFRVNVSGTQLLIEAMKLCGVQKIIFASSSAVYGNAEKFPIDENVKCSPINPYGATKLEGEKLLTEYSKKGISAISFRFFNISGAYKNKLGYWINENRDNETHLIPKIVKHLKTVCQAEKFLIFGTNWPTSDGSCVRDYLHVNDLAAAHLKAFSYFENSKHKIYNLGSGIGSSVFNVIDLAQELTEKKVISRVVQPRAGDAAISYADIQKVCAEINWSPKLSLKDILLSSWYGF